MVIVFIYFRNPDPFQAVGSTLSSKPAPLWSILICFLWVILLTYRSYVTHKFTDQREFFEDFRHGLEEWEYYGEWRTEKEDNRRILIVTNSERGGIAKPCRLWTDYVFEFETKIVRHNTSWLIRAGDTLNYVMLQCQQEQIFPHSRVNGDWDRSDPISLPKTLPMNTWFNVRIIVTGTRVVVSLRVDDEDIEVLNEKLLEPSSMPVLIPVGKGSAQSLSKAISYPMGSVGFRESGEECAHFRNVRVRRIL